MKVPRENKLRPAEIYPSNRPDWRPVQVGNMSEGTIGFVQADQFLYDSFDNLLIMNSAVICPTPQEGCDTPLKKVKGKLYVCLPIRGILRKTDSADTSIIEGTFKYNSSINQDPYSLPKVNTKTNRFRRWIQRIFK